MHPLCAAPPVKDILHTPSAPLLGHLCGWIYCRFRLQLWNWKANKSLTRWSFCLLARHFFFFANPPGFFFSPRRAHFNLNLKLLDSFPFPALPSDSLRFDFSYVLDNPASPVAIPYPGRVPVPSSLVDVQHFWFLTYSYPCLLCALCEFVCCVWIEHH